MTARAQAGPSRAAATRSPSSARRVAAPLLPRSARAPSGAMPKERARRGAAAAQDGDVDMGAAAGAGDAPAQPPLGDVAPMPLFPPLSAADALGGKIEWRKVAVPAHRMTPLKDAWMELYTPVTEQMKVDMRMNLKTRKARAARGRSRGSSREGLRRASRVRR